MGTKHVMNAAARQVRLRIAEAKRRLRREGVRGILRRMLAPQAVFCLAVLTGFWFLRYTSELWEFDNCRPVSLWQAARTLFSFGVLTDWVSAAALWLALYLLLVPLPRWVREVALTLLIAAEAVVGMAEFYMVVWYACPMRDMAAVLRATDRREAREYFSAMVCDGGVLLPTVLFLVVLGATCGIFLGVHKFRAPRRRRFCAAAGGVLLFVLAACCRFNLLLLPDPLIELAVTLRREDPFLVRVAKTVAEPRLPAGIAGALRGRTPVFGVVVIGESDNRRHHSLYGYGKRTDIFLEEGAEGMIRFSDAISATSSTIHSLFFMFTDARVGGKGVPPRYAVCEYFKALGAKEISLHDMQRSHGAWASVMSLLFVNADRKRAYSDDGRNHHDGELLEHVRRECREKIPGAKLLFVHLMGSHYDQRYRVPPEWLAAHASAVAGMDHYDRSIVYTGFVLSELRKIADGMDRPAFLLYIPDHSEEPASRRSSTIPDPVYYEIPMLLWFNAAYRREFPGVVASARAAKDRPFQTDLALQLIARLTGVPEALIAPEEDLLSARYRPPRRFVALGELAYPEKPQTPAAR